MGCLFLEMGYVYLKGEIVEWKCNMELELLSSADLFGKSS